MKPSQDTIVSPLLTTAAQIAGWYQDLLHLHERLAPHFARRETHRHALDYLTGLMSPTERKSCWQLAELAHYARPYDLQHFLSNAVWSADRIRDETRAQAITHLGIKQIILALDETGFPKQGDHSAGVGPQYCGSTGRVENCQVGVFLDYITPVGHTLIDRELYVPADWINDRPRCRQAGIPDALPFRTKPELALLLLTRWLQSCPSLRPSWIVADSLYGSHPGLRTFLEQHQLPYVLSVGSDEPVYFFLPDGSLHGALTGDIAKDFSPFLQWQSLSMGQGSKGPRSSWWARLPVAHQGCNDGRHWLLIRRDPEDPTRLWSFLCFAPLDTPLSQMVTAWGARWMIEVDLQAGKDLGLDRYQVRSFVGWSRHITLVILALAFLRGLCAHEQAQASAGSPADLAPLTTQEARHLLSALSFSAPCSFSFRLGWSEFRRCLRARAAACHARRRARRQAQAQAPP